MRKALTSGVCAVGTCLLPTSLQPTWAATFQADYSILSGLHDTSNLAYAPTRYRGFFSKAADDGDLYINSVMLSPGTNWDPAITLTLPGSELRYNGSEIYTLGTPITGQADWSLDDFASHVGPVDSNVATGIYDFSIDFYGGGNSSDQNLLASIPLQFEVLPGIDFAISGQATPNPLTPGGDAAVKVSLTNNMGDRNLHTTTWFTFVPGFTGPGDGFLDLDHFAGDWFNKTIAPGQTRTDDHTVFSSLPGLPGGPYVGNLGVYVGPNPGDEFQVQVQVDLTVTGGPALPGDADFDGVIDPDDVALTDRGFAMGGTKWTDGDFNDDGAVDQLDYMILDQAIANQSGGGLSPALLGLRVAQFGPGYVSTLLSTVPEPFGLTPLLPAAACLARRKARR